LAYFAALATFVPCYLFTVIPAPYFKKYGRLSGAVAFVYGITAAAIGAITGSVIVLARRSIIDIPTALLALVTVVLLWRLKKLQEPAIIVAAALARLALYPLLHT
jgi:chromate transporter